MKTGYVYILFNQKNGTLYIGTTSNLVGRIYQHKHHFAKGFTDKYNVDRLGYYEDCGSMETAIIREKRLKGGSRKKKIELIEKMNPSWRDLYEEII